MVGAQYTPEFFYICFSLAQVYDATHNLLDLRHSAFKLKFELGRFTAEAVPSYQPF